MSALVKRMGKAVILPAMAAAIAVLADWDWRVTLITVILAMPVGWILSKPPNR